ncbi:hypothetical protein Agub_g668, partial [Astrephomene gubernaculifera]
YTSDWALHVTGRAFRAAAGLVRAYYMQFYDESLRAYQATKGVAATAALCARHGAPSSPMSASVAAAAAAPTPAPAAMSNNSNGAPDRCNSSSRGHDPCEAAEPAVALAASIHAAAATASRTHAGSSVTASPAGKKASPPPASVPP